MNEKINTSLRVQVDVLTWKKFGLLASVKGVDKKNLLSECVTEYVRRHEHELARFTQKAMNE